MGLVSNTGPFFINYLDKYKLSANNNMNKKQ